MTRNDEILVQMTATILAGYYAKGLHTSWSPEEMRESALNEARHIIKLVILQNERSTR